MDAGCRRRSRRRLINPWQDLLIPLRERLSRPRHLGGCSYPQMREQPPALQQAATRNVWFIHNWSSV